MTSTTEPPGQRRSIKETSKVAAAPPPKRRRSPALIATSVLLLSCGGLLGAWVFTSTSDTSTVIGVRSTIERGQLIDEADLIQVQITTDPALKPVHDANEILGKRAATDIAAGSLVTPAAVTTTVVPPEGKSVVGLSLSPSQMPATTLHAGDTIRVVATPGESGDMPTGELSTTGAAVVSVSSAGIDGQRVVDVEVSAPAAPEVAARAATGRIALILETRER